MKLQIILISIVVDWLLKIEKWLQLAPQQPWVNTQVKC